MPSTKRGGVAVDARGPLDRPQFLARLRVEAGEPARDREDELVLLADAGDDRRTPGAEELLAGDARVAARFVHLPHLLAGVLVDREQELALAGAAPQDAQVAVQDR